ncbi:helix-turn-helix domain-containing protein [Flagellimonas nanhaiensis]|uniref:XRE family transcriptional regulator n=1 Tax=Flagellimonas nanhaiensis TaxID=2292706 RepID=A0A371JMW3_9FLAO|nr:helix-turn-helix transcriptional regulator [Allomuricauda nanhaiensis]RDY58482.1 XRE family transcriptional regulator [Allomuricauda nanhaiensis]
MEAKKYFIKKKVLVEQEVEIEGSVEDVVAYNIVRLRKAKGWNQEFLSDKMEISRASISNIEKGRHALSLRNLEKLCEIFECGSTEILPF